MGSSWKRVLALGYKTLPTSSSSDVLSVKDIRELHRGDVESGLTFGGFLIFWCPLKEDSVDAIRMLNESSHRVGIHFFNLTIDCDDHG